MPLHMFRCTECGTHFRVLEVPRHRDRWWLHDDPSCGQECPGCSEPLAEEMIVQTEGFGLPTDMGGEAGVGRFYPRYDHGLGQRVSSAAHRREICRERGLIPAEGQAPMDDWVDAERSEIEKIDRDYAAYIREMHEGPNRGIQEQIRRHLAERFSGRR